MPNNPQTTAEQLARGRALHEAKTTFKSWGYNSQALDGFAAYFHFVGWTAISLGMHLSLRPLHFELHVPFGFFRIGRI